MTDHPPIRTTRNHRPAQLIVTADRRPGAHVADSDDVWWWLPVLGPTATVLSYNLARFARHAEVTWPADELARRIGLGHATSRLWTSLDRLERFGAATFHSTDLLAVRLELPTLTRRQLERLPDEFAARYPFAEAVA